LISVFIRRLHYVVTLTRVALSGVELACANMKKREQLKQTVKDETHVTQMRSAICIVMDKSRVQDLLMLYIFLIKE
jgi:malonyl CoA-acyl carrier protein transacylase